MLVLGETYLIKNWENFYKKYKILGRFHKIKDQMLVNMTLYNIFRGTSPSSEVQMYIEDFKNRKNENSLAEHQKQNN